jgi:predicted RNA-binding protein
MRKVLACVLSLVVGLALLQLAGCKKSEPAAKPEQPGPAAKADPVAAASKKFVGVWKGKPPMPPGAEKGEKKGPPMEMTITVEVKDDGTAVMDAIGDKRNFNWKVIKAEGNKVTLNMETDAPEPPDLGALVGKEKGKEAKPKKVTEEITIVFETDDKITGGPTRLPAEAITLDRQK